MISILNKAYFCVLLISILFLFGCKESVSNPDDNFPDIPSRVEQLLAQMSLDEKIGQMTQAERGALQNITDIKTYFLGSLLSGGGSAPSTNSAQAWADMYDYFQNFALQTRLKIPLIWY